MTTLQRPRPEDQRVTLVAAKDLTYNSRMFMAGDTFEAAPLDAAALTYQRKATLFTGRRSIPPSELRATQAAVAERVLESHPAKIRMPVRRMKPTGAEKVAVKDPDSDE